MAIRGKGRNFVKNFSESNEPLRPKLFPERKKLFDVDFSIFPEKQFSDTDPSFAFKIFSEIWSKIHN